MESYSEAQAGLILISLWFSLSSAGIITTAGSKFFILMLDLIIL